MIRAAKLGASLVLALTCWGTTVSHAQPVGPSSGEANFYFFIPAALSFILSLYMLTSWGRFMALLIAAGCTFIWLVIGRAMLGGSAIGAFMLVLSVWAYFAFAVLALYFTRDRPSAVDAKSDAFGQAGTPGAIIEGPPFGKCPNCQATIALKARECPKCHVVFTRKVGWKVQPL